MKVGKSRSNGKMVLGAQLKSVTAANHRETQRSKLLELKRGAGLLFPVDPEVPGIWGYLG
jgi:hypothetical protein